LRCAALKSGAPGLPTIVGAAGGSTAHNRPLDGFDIWRVVAVGEPAIERWYPSERAQQQL
jgi:hypothetical protein